MLILTVNNLRSYQTQPAYYERAIGENTNQYFQR